MNKQDDAAVHPAAQFAMLIAACQAYVSVEGLLGTGSLGAVLLCKDQARAMWSFA